MKIALLLLSLYISACHSRFVPTSSISFLPADRWSTRGGGPNGTLVYLSKWGSATAVASGAVNATEPPFPTKLGLLYGMGSSNGYARVAVNGAVIDTINTFGSTTNYTNEFNVSLSGLPNHPLWVMTIEATGTWQKGSMDSYIEIVGVNVYF